jgi:formate dehydrogenase maturation protein FdhE
MPADPDVTARKRPKADERYAPCSWCVTRGHVVIECMKCKGAGRVKLMVNNRARWWLNHQIARVRTRHHPRLSDSRSAGLFLRRIQLLLIGAKEWPG